MFLDKITFVKSGHLHLFLYLLSPYLGYPNTYGFRLQFVLYPGYEVGKMSDFFSLIAILSSSYWKHGK